MEVFQNCRSPGFRSSGKAVGEPDFLLDQQQSSSAPSTQGQTCLKINRTSKEQIGGKDEAAILRPERKMKRIIAIFKQRYPLLMLSGALIFVVCFMILVYNSSQKTSMDFHKNIQNLSTSIHNLKNEIQVKMANAENQAAIHTLSIQSLKRVLGTKIHKNQTTNGIETIQINSCSAIQQFQGPGPLNTTFEIYPFAVVHENSTFKPGNGTQVSCDFKTEGGRWTIIQRRVSGPRRDFYRGWAEYEEGFGSSLRNFWIGLKTMHALTKNVQQELYIELKTWDGTITVARYDHFAVAGPSEAYRLTATGYSGNAGDHLSSHDGCKFSTRDRNNGKTRLFNSAEKYSGAYWYQDEHCTGSQLNGLYFNEGERGIVPGCGLSWSSIGLTEQFIQRVEMKIRPVIYE